MAESLLNLPKNSNSGKGVNTERDAASRIPVPIVKELVETADVKNSSAKAWLRALELTAPIPRNRDRILSNVIRELAERQGEATALLSEDESLTYRDLAELSNRYARWALDQGLQKGEVVGLLMTNRPEYVAIWLGISSIGCVVALLNFNLSGSSLAHCVNIVSPKHLIVAADLLDSATSALQALAFTPAIWAYGPGNGKFPRIDPDIEQRSGEVLSGSERRSVTIDDRALYIYTSGTTGLPKAANVSHARVMQWSHWFAGMMGTGTTDRLYNCLPMYHSIGGVVAPGAALVGGGSIVIRNKFSASRFWSELVRWDCTLFQYIGELCRYLLHAPPTIEDSGHRIRMACGNGLAPEIWEAFKHRFRIPRIFEFYAATEGGVSLFNIEGKCGAIGHIPAYLAHRFSPALVRFDLEAEEPARNEQGFCIRCERSEIGEALARAADDSSAIGSRFEGYTSGEATDKRILRDVFEPGDSWVRTGDLMRKDEKGYFYFVNRIGDTFRWKGENVATSEVAEVFCAFGGIRHANVYGVAVPGAEGRAGMAALVADHGLDLKALRDHIVQRLPYYARPLFLRIRNDVELTGTFKYSKVELIREGFDPSVGSDVFYLDDPESKAFVRLDQTLYQRILLGGIRN